MEIDEGNRDDNSYGNGTCAFSYKGKGFSYCSGAFHDIRGPVTDKQAFVQMIQDHLKEKAN